MGQKYLPTVRDQKAAQRFQAQQRRRQHKETPAVATPPAAPKAPAKSKAS